MIQACVNNCCWLLSNLMIVNWAETNGFKVGESTNDTDCDLPLCFGNQVLAWDNGLFSIISQDGAVPVGEAPAFVRGCDGKGFNFFRYGNSKFRVNLIKFPECVYGIHSKQDGRSF